MGIFDKLSGTKKPAAGTPARTPLEVTKAILAINREWTVTGRGWTYRGVVFGKL